MLDALEATEANLRRLEVGSVEDVRQCRERLVGFGPRLAADNAVLRDFLMRRVYGHPRVVRMVTKAEGFVERLFDLYNRVPTQLPLDLQASIETEGRERVIADYLSGMTDRFLLDDYVRAFEPEPFLRR
jgi:dGTPase